MFMMLFHEDMLKNRWLAPTGMSLEQFKRGKVLKFDQYMAGRNVTRLECDGNELNLNLLTKHCEIIMVHHFMNKFYE